MSKNHDQQREIDRILGFLGPRPLLIITVRRVEPKWCSGYLGTAYIETEDEDIHDVIRRRFGGGTFRLQIKDAKGRYLAHRTVSICGGI